MLEIADLFIPGVLAALFLLLFGAYPESRESTPPLWGRCTARFIDTQIGFLLLAIPLFFLAPSLRKDAAQCGLLHLWMGGVLLWVVPESVLLSVWGSTPGKWLLNLLIRDSQNNTLQYLKALRRSSYAACAGMGLGFLPLTVLTLIIQARRLAKKGMTPWDESTSAFVRQHQLGVGKLILAFVVVVLLVALVKLTYLNYTELA